jgi:signal transduction histidine kinase/DNA-binding NarL/FixJ family response regulator
VRERQPIIDAADWLVGGGEMAKAIKVKDWSRTPLGSIESWPQSLRTVISLSQASSSPISIAWGPGHTQIYNDGYWPICGAKHPTSMGQDFRECWASAFPVIGDAYRSAWSGKGAYLEKQRMFLDRFGILEETWFTFSFSPITDESGGIGGLFHTVTELTSQMLSERRTKTLRDLASAGRARTTREAFALSREVIEGSNLDIPFALFYVIAPDGRTARLVAHTGVEAVCATTVDLESGDDLWGIREVVAKRTAGHVGDLERRLAGLTVGPYPEVPREALVLPIMQPGSETPAAVMIAGASARLRMNEDYRGFYDLVAAAVASSLANARAYEEERNRAEALARIDQAKTTFFSNVSHEFRTPLTLILGPVEDALSTPEKALQGARLEAVHRNSVRLLRLVNRLLDFSRIEAGRIEVAFEPTNLPALTTALAGSFRSLVEEAGLGLTVDCPPLEEPVFVDRAHWEKIVLNLISNAFKFTFAGEIVISLRSHGDHVELSVRDTGTGISADELPRIFDRFHRVKGAHGRSFEGTGIGLALVQELVKLHGGSIRATSTLAEGSTFVVSIPTGSAHLPADHVRAGIDLGAPTGSPYVLEATRWDDQQPIAPGAAASERVLVVDDNLDMLAYLADLLKDHYQLDIARDGEEALRAARAHPPDLVLSDVMMPKLDGFGLLHALRTDPRTSLIPVVLLSARAGDEAIVEGLDTGADDYLIKPFSARELLARVRTQIEMVRMRRASIEHQERERSVAMLRFLGHASMALAESLDYATTLAKIARLAVPALADWCWVDAIDDNGTIRRLSLAHADMGQGEVPLRVAQLELPQHPADPIVKALRTRRPVLVEDFSELHDEHLQAIRDTHARSMIATPLVARGRVLGVIAFVSTHHQYGATELAVVEELAYRCAVAVDNARLYREARTAVQARDEFMAIASHELRTPLTPLQLELDTLATALVRDDWSRQRLAAKVDKASRQTERLSKLVENLLDMSRIATGKLVLEPEPVDLGTLARELADRFTQQARASETELIVRVDGGVVGRWDRVRLEQVLSNLIANAIKYGRGKPVEITVRRSESAAELRVIDRGIGVSPEDAARIFDRFERAVSIHNYGGLGLGLYISREIVEAHGGTITVTSKVGQGAVFEVRLPIHARN